MEYRDKQTHEEDTTSNQKMSQCTETISPIVTVDYERYAHLLEGSDLSKEQKHEFLQALWNIITEFVFLGFGVHPLQQAQNDCGQDNGKPPKPALTAPDLVYLDHKLLVDNLGETAKDLVRGIES